MDLKIVAFWVSVAAVVANGFHLFTRLLQGGTLGELWPTIITTITFIFIAIVQFRAIR
jgi:hypothetical protein